MNTKNTNTNNYQSPQPGGRPQSYSYNQGGVANTPFSPTTGVGMSQRFAPPPPIPVNNPTQSAPNHGITPTENWDNNSVGGTISFGNLEGFSTGAPAPAPARQQQATINYDPPPSSSPPSTQVTGANPNPQPLLT